jgi:hypothetical protein
MSKRDAWTLSSARLTQEKGSPLGASGRNRHTKPLLADEEIGRLPAPLSKFPTKSHVEQSLSAWAQFFPSPTEADASSAEMALSSLRRTPATGE